MSCGVARQKIISAKAQMLSCTLQSARRSVESLTFSTATICPIRMNNRVCRRSGSSPRVSVTRKLFPESAARLFSRLRMSCKGLRVEHLDHEAGIPLHPVGCGAKRLVGQSIGRGQREVDAIPAALAR